MTNYNTNYGDLMTIAKETVKQSTGLGFSRFDKSKVLLSVERASRMAALSERCRELASNRHSAFEKVRAATILGVDATEYQREFDKVQAEYYRVSAKVDEVVSHYEKDYHGVWRIDVDTPVVI